MLRGDKCEICFLAIKAEQGITICTELHLRAISPAAAAAAGQKLLQIGAKMVAFDDQICCSQQYLLTLFIQGAGFRTTQSFAAADLQTEQSYIEASSSQVCQGKPWLITRFGPFYRLASSISTMNLSGSSQTSHGMFQLI